jgi:hypothetical protein
MCSPVLAAEATGAATFRTRCACCLSGEHVASGAETERVATAGNCEPQGCGLNGAWLGQQVKFRELRTDGGANGVGLKITGFASKIGQPLRLAVVGDELIGHGIGTPAPVELRGAALDGAKISLSNSVDGAVYTLTIEKVMEQGAFWTGCDSSTAVDCGNAPTTRLYQFSATDGQGACIEVCKPGMAEDYHTLNGTAVIFKDDLYRDDFTVRSVDGTGGSTLAIGEDSLFNIACVGTSISKMYFLHHTSVSTDPANKTTVEQRQALLRLFAGDYCGIGHSFTEDGHPIRLDFDKSTLRPNEQVGLAPTLSVDAMWKGNGTGASCIGTPRLADGSKSPDDLVKEIAALCPQVVAVPCEAGRLQMAKAHEFGGDYAISANMFQ